MRALSTPATRRGPVTGPCEAGPVRVRRVTTTRAGGRSTGPFSRFNLSRGVGDDPVAVAGEPVPTQRELGLDGVVFLQQVHGTDVEVVDRAPRSSAAPDVPERDAVVTTTPGLGVAVLAADCVPVLLGDPQAGVVGAAHAGRVGAAAGVLTATVETMTGLGAQRRAARGAARTGHLRPLLRGARRHARRGGGRPAGQRGRSPLRDARAGPAGRPDHAAGHARCPQASARTRAARSRTPTCTATAARPAPAARPP